MPTSTLASRGQTEIPKPIREAPGLQPGDRIEFILEDDHALLRPARADISTLDGVLAHLEKETVSLEEMDEAKGGET